MTKIIDVMAQKKKSISTFTDDKLKSETKGIFTDLMKICPTCQDWTSFNMLIFGCVIYHYLVCEMERRGIEPNVVLEDKDFKIPVGGSTVVQ